jgi:hypothetical protein
LVLGEKEILKVRLTFVLVFVVAIAALVGGGCGDDDESSSAANDQSDGASVTTSSLDKAAFIKQASAACAKERKSLVNEATAYLEKPAVKKQPEGTAVANMARAVMVPTIEAEIAAVTKLGAPAGDEEQVEAMLAAQQVGVEEVKGLKQAKSLEDIEAHFRDATKLYEAYGFEACTNSP